MSAQRYTIADRATAAAHVRPYRRTIDDPPFRPMRIFALDPATSVLDGSIATVAVPFEPLQHGFQGALFDLDLREPLDGFTCKPVDPNATDFTLASGFLPAAADPRFHQQSIYAVASLVYSSFQHALGRDLSWGFDPHRQGNRLRLQPYACAENNAYYDRDAAALRFGYYAAQSKVSGRNLPGGWVFTALSHDIVAHEMAHALLDGLRGRFLVPSNPDVLALHEGFADLVAVFQHFSYPDVVRAALRAARGRMTDATLLTDIAQQFGQTSLNASRLRSAIDLGEVTSYQTVGYEEHARGSVLVTAVFRAFTTVFARRTEQLLRLATNGTGVLPEGELMPDLLALLGREASKVAKQFLTVCIRALDYCPPVDVTFGEYLRAVITADEEMVPHDPYGYREAWLDAFWARDIYPHDVGFLSVDALRWRPPQRDLPKLTPLDFAELAFDGDPGRAAGEHELRRQAHVLGDVVSRDEHLAEFGLARPGDPRLDGDVVDPPCIESIRSARRSGPNGRVVFDLVAEVTQRRHVRASPRGDAFAFFGGATIIIDPYGQVRYVIRKSILQDDRLAAQRRFMQSHGASRWSLRDGTLKPERQPFRLLHRTTA